MASTTVRDAAEQAAQLARLQAAQAALLARSAAEKAAPRVAGAVDWASPRIEKSLLSAGPAVEAAAGRVAPAVDAARDRIVEDLLPRVVEAVNAAAAASATAQRAAADRVSASLESAATSVVAAPPPSPGRGRRLLVLSTFAAAGAAAVTAWSRSRATGPQWDALDAGEPAFTGGPEPTPSTLPDSAAPSSGIAAGTGTPADALVDAGTGSVTDVDALDEGAPFTDSAAVTDAGTETLVGTETVIDAGPATGTVAEETLDTTEPPHGDPLLEGLGTAEITPDTTSSVVPDVTLEATPVVDEVIIVTESTVGEDLPPVLVDDIATTTGEPAGTGLEGGSAPTIGETGGTTSAGTPGEGGGTTRPRRRK